MNSGIKVANELHPKLFSGHNMQISYSFKGKVRSTTDILEEFTIFYSSLYSFQGNYIV